jgi:hypothetical protein
MAKGQRERLPPENTAQAAQAAQVLQAIAQSGAMQKLRQGMANPQQAGANPTGAMPNLQQAGPSVGGAMPGQGMFGTIPASTAGAGMPEPDGAQGLDGLQLGGQQKIGAAEIAKASDILQKYKNGKSALERRLIDNEQWYKLAHWKQYKNPMMGDKENGRRSSGWLFNSIANKHADAMDNYPEPNVLPRARDDEETARTLSSVLPALLEQADYEQVYSDTWWRKLKQGTGVKGVFWDPTLRGGLGDICIKSMDLLMLFWEPGVNDIQDSPHFFSLALEDNDRLIQKWPQLAGHTGRSMTTAQYVHDDAIDTSDKSVVVDWYYKVEGAGGGKTVLHYCKFCNGVVLYASENDPQLAQRGFYDHGRYPFVFDTLFVEEDSPAGFGYIDVMKDCQTSIDKLNQAMDENVLLASKQRYVVSDAAGVNEDELCDFSRDVVHVSGRLSEESFAQLQVSGLQGNSLSYLNNRIDEIKEISGNRDISQGGTTSGITAASAIAALQEAGSKLSRDMLKSAYRAFTKECYLVIDLIRQFYDEERMFRITGQNGQNQYVGISGQQLRAQPMGSIGGVMLGGREPVFDITVSAAKKSTFSKLSQNETAKECYQLGFFNPANADAALAALDMMDFEGIEKVRDRVSQNGTLLQQLQQMQQQMQQMAQIIDLQNGGQSNLTGQVQAATGSALAMATGGKPGTAEAKTTTDGLGAAVGSKAGGQATAAAQRAMDVNNPNR